MTKWPYMYVGLDILIIHPAHVSCKCIVRWLKYCSGFEGDLYTQVHGTCVGLFSLGLYTRQKWITSSWEHHNIFSKYCMVHLYIELHNILEQRTTHVLGESTCPLNFHQYIFFHFVGEVTLFIWAATSFCMASVWLNFCSIKLIEAIAWKREAAGMSSGNLERNWPRRMKSISNKSSW